MNIFGGSDRNSGAESSGKTGTSNPTDLERKLDDYLTAQYEMLEDMTGNTGITHPFRYPADAHNLKVLVRRQDFGDAKGTYAEGQGEDGGVFAGEMRSMDGNRESADNLLKRGGTVEAEELRAQLEKYDAGINIRSLSAHFSSEKNVSDFHETVQRLCESAIYAYQQFAHTADSHMIEEIIDNAAREAIQYKLQELGIRDMKSAGVQGSDSKTERFEFSLPAFKNPQISPFGADSIAAYIHALMRAIHACRLTLTLKYYNISSSKIIERINRIYEN